jgi:hypothetical protein
MSKNVSIAEAAERLGKSRQFVRIGLQDGFLKFGTAVKMSSKWTYHISPALLDGYLGSENQSREGE